MRKTYVRFQGISKVIFDHRGLGDAFPQFLSQPWLDPDTGKEYPPWVLDDEKSIIHNAKPLLRSVKGNPVVNQQLANCLRVALEQHSIEIPINSRQVNGGKVPNLSEEDEPTGKERSLSAQERAIYLEADALQIEMGNVVMKVSAAGNYQYETARSNQRKDRYSSLAMAVRYVAEQEEVRRKRLAYYAGGAAIGIVSKL